MNYLKLGPFFDLDPNTLIRFVLVPTNYEGFLSILYLGLSCLFSTNRSLTSNRYSMPSMSCFSRRFLSAQIRPKPFGSLSPRASRTFQSSRIDQDREKDNAAEILKHKRRVDQLRKEAVYEASSIQATQATHNFGNAYQSISWRPLIVGVGICASAFLAAEYLDGRADSQTVAILSKAGWRSGTVAEAGLIVSEMQTKRTLRWLDQIPGTDAMKYVYLSYRQWRARQPDEIRATVILIAANAIVFLGWSLAARSPALMSKMERSFVHFPGCSAAYTVLTSVFSHKVCCQSALHSGHS